MIIRIAFKVKAPVGIAAGRGFPFGNDVIGMAHLFFPAFFSKCGLRRDRLVRRRVSGLRTTLMTTNGPVLQIGELVHILPFCVRLNMHI